MFGSQPDGGIRTLLKVAGTDIDVHHGKRATLTAFGSTVEQPHNSPRLMERQTPQPGAEVPLSCEDTFIAQWRLNAM